jgi:hypothetical protein
MSAEYDFDDLAGQLASADQLARSASADSSAARAERSRIAVSTILAAVSQGTGVNVMRSSLLGSGVLKGTVSKVITVTKAIRDGWIKAEDVKSLSGAYAAVAAVRAAASSGTGAPVLSASASSTVWSDPASAGPPARLSPEEALEIILDEVRGAGDPFKVGGEWITRFTNQITAAIKEHDDVEDEE